MDFSFIKVDDYIDYITNWEKDFPKLIETERLLLKKQASDSAAILYFIYLKESNENIGPISIMADGEIWYKIYSDHNKNKGYMTEALSGLIEKCTCNYLYLSIQRDNKASIKVAKKLKLKYEGKSSSRKCLIYSIKKSN